jgi:NAD+ kinase
MRIRRVLVVYRKSVYQIYVQEHNEHAVKQALRQGDAVALGLRESHKALQQALASVERTMRRLGIEVVCRWRAHVRSPRNFDLVLSLGGDGTLLDTSHRILDGPPLLGVNSDPGRSVGVLCAGTTEDLPRLLEDLMADRLRPKKVTRIRVRVGGEEVLGPTLNDLLFAHACPAGLTRFDMATVPGSGALDLHSGHDGRAFRHFRGSGIWIATATGSTAAMHSAGGRAMPRASRRLQYRVREPYRIATSPPWSLHSGMIAPGQAMVLVSRIRSAVLWSDGVHRALNVGYGQQVVLDHHPHPLLLIRAPQ